MGAAVSHRCHDDAPGGEIAGEAAAPAAWPRACPAAPEAPADSLNSPLLILTQIKCDQYWPNRGTETYGFIQVTLLDTMELATFCIRTFSLHKVWPGEGRRSTESEWVPHSQHSRKPT